MERERLVPQLLDWGTNNVLYFQKAKNYFTASSHQNAGFSTLSFQKFSGGNTPGPSQRKGTTLSRTQHPARPLVGRGAQVPGVVTKTLVPLNFLAVVAPLLSDQELNIGRRELSALSPQPSRHCGLLTVV